MTDPKLLMLICTRPLLIPLIKVFDCSSSKTLIYELQHFEKEHKFPLNESSIPQSYHAIIPLLRPKIYLLDMFKKRFGRRFQSENLTGILSR